MRIFQSPFGSIERPFADCRRSRFGPAACRLSWRRVAPRPDTRNGGLPRVTQEPAQRSSSMLRQSDEHEVVGHRRVETQPFAATVLGEEALVPICGSSEPMPQPSESRPVAVAPARTRPRSTIERISVRRFTEPLSVCSSNSFSAMTSLYCRMGVFECALQHINRTYIL